MEQFFDLWRGLSDVMDTVLGIWVSVRVWRAWINETPLEPAWIRLTLVLLVLLAL